MRKLWFTYLNKDHTFGPGFGRQKLSVQSNSGKNKKEVDQQKGIHDDMIQWTQSRVHIIRHYRP